jgi:hypothetical protein
LSGGALPTSSVSAAGSLQGGRVVLGSAAVQACVAGVFGHLVQGRAPVCPLPLGVGEQVGEQEPAVPARLFVGDFAVFQEFDQGGQADAEEVGGLLGGQPLGARYS